MELFITTYNQDILNRFIAGYNLTRQDTSQNINLLIDDRNKSISEFDLSKAHFVNKIYKVTDLVNYGSKKFSHCNYYEGLMKIYPITFKKQIFPYLYDQHGINKSMLMDDDILYIKPLDAFFDECTVVKSDSMKADDKMLSCLRDVFESNVVDKLNKNLINSGTFLYTYDDRLVKDLYSFYSSSHVMGYMSNAHIRSQKMGKPRIAGMASIIEQLFYGCHLISISKPISNFKSAVQLVTATPDLSNELTITKVNNLYHFLMRNKIPYMDHYLKALQRSLT